MRILFPLLALLFTLLARPIVPRPPPVAGPDLAFAAPVRVVVTGAESVAFLALTHGVTAQELTAWNGLVGDLEPGMTLLIWPSQRRDVVRAPEPAAPPAAAVRTTKKTATPGRAARRPERHAVASAGILGATDGGGALDAALVSGVAGLRRQAAATTASGLEQRGDMRTTGEIGSLAPSSLKRQPVAVVSEGRVRVPDLPRPRARSCLRGPTGSEGVRGDRGMVAAKGLNKAQIRATMNRLVPRTGSCIPTNIDGSVQVRAEFVVGCNGLVTSVQVSGALPRKSLRCLESALGRAGFPGHDMPDGASFVYPITYRR